MSRPTPPILVALAAVLGGCAEAATPATCPTAQAGWNRGFKVAGQARSFYAIFPEPTGAPAPLLIAFNGTTEDGAVFAARAGLQDFADKGFVVLAPSSHGNGVYWPVWDGLRPKGHEADPNADLALFDALVGCAPSWRAIDPARIFVAGHSAGGIFSNHVLQRRSSVLAGGIVASGVYSQTSPVPAEPLDPMSIIVTWGGSNDAWSGAAGTAAGRNFGFVSEAAVASHAYAKAPGVSVVSCEGEELGHAWLDGINGWMADLLLAHPKGAPINDLPPTPSNGRAHCVLGPVDEPRDPGISCPASVVPGCQVACQQVADGAVTNHTVGPLLRPQLRHLGFPNTSSCAGCIAHCEELATSPADAEVLACMVRQPPVDRSVGGLAGTMPLVDAVNTCCEARSDSGWCLDVCKEMRSNLASRAYFDRCPTR